MATIEIKTKGPSGKIFINGKEVPDVRGYLISHKAGRLPVFRMDIIASDITFNGSEFLPELPEVFKDFYEQKKSKRKDF
jgi:hypothetical protein